VKTIKNRAGLQHGLCTPLLGMVDQLGVSRLEAHRGVLQAARQTLMARVQVRDCVFMSECVFLLTFMVVWRVAFIAWHVCVLWNGTCQ